MKRLHMSPARSRRNERPAVEARPTADANRALSVLFLCTGNSARSIMAEAILRRDGAGRFNAFSAGSPPAGRVDPHAIETLHGHGYPVAQLRSKSWGEFETPEAPSIDIVITVFDDAASEACPLWPSAPVSAHWGVPDPAATEGSEHDKRVAFDTAFGMLARRIGLMLDIPIVELGRSALQANRRAIGRTR
jgi:arsenate reductase